MSQNPYAPPTAEVADRSLDPASAPAPALWNPNAAALWSLLLTPAFGAFLQMKNWQALGEPARAKVSRNWVFITIGALLLLALVSGFLPDTKGLDAASRGAGIGLLVAWYMSHGREQIRWVLGRYGKVYPRRGWALALLGGVAAMFAFLLALFVIGVVAATVFGLE